MIRYTSLQVHNNGYLTARQPIKASRPSSCQAATTESAKSHQGRSHHCNFCDYKTDNVCHLKRHTMCHTGERPFECHLCPQSFAHKFNLKVHLRTHTGDKPFQCPSCPRSFNGKGNLNEHLRTHTAQVKGMARNYSVFHLPSEIRPRGRSGFEESAGVISTQRNGPGSLRCAPPVDKVHHVVTPTIYQLDDMRCYCLFVASLCLVSPTAFFLHTILF
ncbi:zinc finger protein 771-like isoform X2 [Dermacentor albipictus]|uniref:zinc finger protein 771-like isoform X2 n=1 Tax=Dermacentor albipictus TaxID=60249 RepID=UPI0031FE0918